MRARYWKPLPDGSYSMNHAFHVSDRKEAVRRVGPPNPGERLTLESGGMMGAEVLEANEFGTWDSIASGPAGDGIIGAMEE